MLTTNALYKTTSDTKSVQVPIWLILLQCLTFVLLYSVWILPEIVFWRNIALVVGALSGLYVSYQYRSLLAIKKALPIWLIGALFLWACFHILFLSQSPAAQLHEFTGVWKRALLAVLFALGLGLSLGNNSETVKKWAWPTIYFGLLMPSLIYLLKWVLTYYGEGFFGVGSIPDSLKAHVIPQLFYVPKTDYTVFCLPTLGVALGQISLLFKSKGIKWISLLIYVMSIMAVFFVFYGQNIKNGFLYGALLFFIFLVVVIRNTNALLSPLKISLITIASMGLALGIYKHIQQNDSWATFMADAKIAVQLDRYQEWKFSGEKGYPINEMGKLVSNTNYERVAWGLAGANLLIENPLGYGLVDNSYGSLARKKWPESRLTQSHSGWLDLALGIGFPGIVVVLFALVLALRFTKYVSLPWGNLGFWGLLSTLLLWCTSEVSNDGGFDPLLFWIVLTASFSLGSPSRPK